MLHQIGNRLCELIYRFSGELCTWLGKVACAFVKEMIYGVPASGSVVLTRIARSLEGSITVHDTDPTLADAILDRLIHNAYKINLKGESMRMKKSKLTQPPDSE